MTFGRDDRANLVEHYLYTGYIKKMKMDVFTDLYTELS